MSAVRGIAPFSRASSASSRSRSVRVASRDVAVVGARGATITDLDQVPAVLAAALAHPGPTLLDVKSSIAKSPIYSLPVRAGIYG